MAKRIFQQATWTPTAQADGVLTGSWQALKGGAATDILRINKILLMGQASSSSVNAMCLARSSTLAITPTALALPNSDAPANIAAATLSSPPTAFVAASTAPNRSPAVSIARLNLTFNSFGGILQWQTNPGSDEEWISVGVSTTSNSESVLSAFNTGTAGPMASDIFYEVL